VAAGTGGDVGELRSSSFSPAASEAAGRSERLPALPTEAKIPPLLELRKAVGTVIVTAPSPASVISPSGTPNTPVSL
jgi:hypothetical protein